MKHRIQVKVRQLDGSYKYMNVYGNTIKEVNEKAAKKQAEAEEKYIKCQ